MTRLTLWLCAGLLLTGCGIKRPLMRPSDIPAYEAEQQRKLQSLQDDRAIPSMPEPDSARRTATPMPAATGTAP